MPTAAHVIYIPAMLMLGVVLGYILGSRAARDAMLAEQARKEARAARRAAAAAKESSLKDHSAKAQDGSPSSENDEAAPS